MKTTLLILVAILAILSLTGCSLRSLKAPTPQPTPTLVATPTPPPATPAPVASATPVVAVATPTLSLPTATTGLAPTAARGGILPGNPSGPYGVIQVATGDVLNIRTGPGTSNPVSGSFSATNTTVMRAGPSSNVGGSLWVQVQNPGKALGWVNAAFLTEYVAPTAFCANGSVNTLLSAFANAIKTSNGQALSGLVSPVHGMTVRLWRNGNAVVFDQAHALYIFTSTYKHDWGAAPGSGLDTMGSIHAMVIPKWLDVLNASSPGYTLGCNTPLTGGASYDTSWPKIYANINYYSLYKPGPTGNENSWRTLLVGVEFVQGSPYIFSVTQLQWEP